MEAFFWRLWRSDNSFLRWLLRPLSWPWALGAAIRNFLYDRGLLPVYRSPAFVISIGNITVGGTGKTPLLLALCQELDKQNKDYTILTRGYRSGDEVQLLRRRLNHPKIIVDRNRVRGAKKAISSILILDDGLQRRDIARDCEIICLDERDPLGCNSFIPSGFLRDSPRSLSRADFLVGPQSAAVRKYSSAPLITLRKRVFLEGNRMPFGLFAAVADPSRIERAAAEIGLEVVDSHWLSDHAPLTPQLLEAIFERAKAKGAKGLLCTEKDGVKIDWKPSMPICFLKLEVTGIDPILKKVP